MLKTWRLFGCLLAFCSRPGFAYETDQYESQPYPLSDSTEVLDVIVNAEIDDLVQFWNGPQEHAAIAYALAHRFAKRQVEVWAQDSDAVEVWHPGTFSVYRHINSFISPVVRAKGLGPTLKLNGVAIGVDKITHFFGVGAVYFAKYLNEGGGADGQKSAIEFGEHTENTYWGLVTTGVYSNADMVANYEGMRFLIGLFEDNHIPGKPALLRWQGDRLIKQRPFTFRDYVNDYWNEALNPNTYSITLAPHMRRSLQAYCLIEPYRSQLELYVSKHDAVLADRYRDIGLSEGREAFLLPNICAEFLTQTDAERQKWLKDNQKFLQATERLPKKLGLKQDINKIRAWVQGKPVCESEVEAAYAEMQALHHAVESRRFTFYQIFLSRLFFGNKARIEDDPYTYQDFRTLGENRICLWDSPLGPEELRAGLNLQIRVCAEPDASGRLQYSTKYLADFTNGILHQIENLNEILSNIMDARFSYHSSEQMDYFNFDQVSGYIYRTIPPLCRWF